MNSRRLIPLILAATVIFASCRPPEKAPPVVEDLSYELRPGGARIVTGKVYNPTDEAIDNVQIQLSLFGADNELVGSMHIVVKDIGAGERVPFREPVDSDEAEAARVKSILVM